MPLRANHAGGSGRSVGPDPPASNKEFDGMDLVPIGLYAAGATAIVVGILAFADAQ